MDARATVTLEDILIERDVDVPMRDGAKLKADVFRPKGGERVPALLNLGPYQKDKLWNSASQPGGGGQSVDELGDRQPAVVGVRAATHPCVWTGAAAASHPASVNPGRGLKSVDFHDAIEWAAAQPWCNGNVGLSGISYYAINQWFAANHQPPSLKAIIPWEDVADIYRDALFHGGILCLFMTNWYTAHLLHHTVGRASQQVPNASGHQHAAILG